MKPHASHSPVVSSGFFDRLSSHISRVAGLPATFFAALFIVFIWAASGPMFGYSEVWQLVINTGTTIITFLLLFIVQNTQNRDTTALQLKLDAIIYVLSGCDDNLINAEDLTLKELETKVDEFKKKAAHNLVSPKCRPRRSGKPRATKPRKALP